MAQRTEKEETEFNMVPESITPCINNCTVAINPTTTTTSSSPATFPPTTPVPLPSSSSPKLSPSSPRLAASDPMMSSRLSDPSSIYPVKREVNRCWGCKRKVGLTGFRCRCGELFCSTHRYSDRHDCTYDYKSAGREAIERENPVVKAAKIIRI